MCPLPGGRCRSILGNFINTFHPLSCLRGSSLASTSSMANFNAFLSGPWRIWGHSRGRKIVESIMAKALFNWGARKKENFSLHLRQGHRVFTVPLNRPRSLCDLKVMALGVAPMALHQMQTGHPLNLPGSCRTPSLVRCAPHWWWLVTSAPPTKRNLLVARVADLSNVSQTCANLLQKCAFENAGTASRCPNATFFLTDEILISHSRTKKKQAPRLSQPHSRVAAPKRPRHGWEWDTAWPHFHQRQSESFSTAERQHGAPPEEPRRCGKASVRALNFQLSQEFR